MPDKPPLRNGLTAVHTVVTGTLFSSDREPIFTWASYWPLWALPLSLSLSLSLFLSNDPNERFFL
jgi:hypothetical protein